MATHDATDDFVTDAIRRVRAGEREAFRVLVEQFQRPLFCVLRRYTDNDDDSLDLVQKTLVKAYQQLDRLENPASFKGWLFRIGVNLALNDRRAASRRPTVAMDETHEQSVPPVAEEALMKQQSMREVRNALDALSPMQRDVLLLRVDGDLSYKEIADSTGSTSGAVRVHFHNAIKRLKKLLTRSQSELRAVQGKKG